MDADYELYLIIQELNRIINELDSVSNGVRRNFSGIGNERCAQSISSIANDYRIVKRKLSRIDTTNISE